LLVERAVVVFRHAPFVVVIIDVERVVFLGPRTAKLSVRMQYRTAHYTFSPGQSNFAQSGFRGSMVTPPAVSGVPAACASATRSRRSMARPRSPACEPVI